MRTTLDLPDELLKQAKIAAVERGSTLRELVVESLRRALAEKAPLARKRIKLPLEKLAADAPVRQMSLEDLKQLEADDEAEHFLAVHRRR